MANKQPKLYRTPRKPGYLGGYNWRATTLGCLLLVVVNFIATQYIAARFWYQPALDAPILRSKSASIYLPFSWIVWGWHYCTSQDERIRRPFFEGEMMVFTGSLLCVGIFFVLTSSQLWSLPTLTVCSVLGVFDADGQSIDISKGGTLLGCNCGSWALRRPMRTGNFPSHGLVPT